MRITIPRGATLAVAAVMFTVASCGTSSSSIRGDWDYYRTLGAKPSGGFDGIRRFGFAHFENADTAGAWIKRRLGTPLEHINGLKVAGDSLILSLAAGTSIRAKVSRDTISGQYYRGTARRRRCTSRTTRSGPDHIRIRRSR